MSNEVFLPRLTGAVGADEMWRWYGNIQLELVAGFMTPAEREYVTEYYKDAGLLRRLRRSFFRRHYCDSFTRAAEYLSAGRTAPRILDLGCGFGTQALFLALRGATVIGVDLDETALGIFRKRLEFYQTIVGRDLDVDVLAANTLAFDYKAISPIDGVYSMFAFNMMQPTSRLFHALSPAMSPGGRFAIIDGNRSSWVAKFLFRRRRDVLSPGEFDDLLRSLGFEIDLHEGGVALPPILWSVLPRGLLLRIDARLVLSWLLSTSHVLHARRASGAR